MMQTETVRPAPRPTHWPSHAALTMPDPDGASATAVVRYVAALQQADAALAAELAADPVGPATARRQAQRGRVDAAIHRQVLLAARRMGHDRAESLATLDGIFALGHAPTAPLDGPYQGTGITSTVWAPLDSFSRVLTQVWLPWKGKRLSAATASGDNIFPEGDLWLGRLLWPTYHDYQPYRPGLATGFTFHTYIGPGVYDPGVSTLKLDYALPTNPRLLIRSVLDEVVQLSARYYFGKAYIVLPRQEKAVSARRLLHPAPQRVTSSPNLVFGYILRYNKEVEPCPCVLSRSTATNRIRRGPPCPPIQGAANP